MPRMPIQPSPTPLDPSLEIEECETDGAPGARYYYVAITDAAVDTGDLSDQAPRDRVLIATATEDRFCTFPVHVRRGARDYLQPKYGTLTKITFSNERPEWAIPPDPYAFEELLSYLPTGFARQFQYGLGMTWEYRFLAEAAASVNGVNELVIRDGDDIEIAGNIYYLGDRRFDQLRRGIDRISSKHQKDALETKRLLAYSNLLRHPLPEQFPLRTKKIRPGEIYELVRIGNKALSRDDRKAAISLVRENREEIAKSDPVELLQLRADIEKVTLAALIEKFEDMLSKDLPEPKWQEFLKENAFILSLAFAYPVFLVQDQAYVGGATLRGVGEKFADFLTAQRYRANLALIEIKRPSSPLLSAVPYRESLFCAHKELSGAMAQVLDQRYRLHLSFTQKIYESDLRDVHPYAIQCIVIAGKTPEGKAEKKSLELLRNASKDVTVLTFDELLDKLKEIQRVFDAGEAETTNEEPIQPKPRPRPGAPRPGLFADDGSEVSSSVPPWARATD